MFARSSLLFVVAVWPGLEDKHGCRFLFHMCFVASSFFAWRYFGIFEMKAIPSTHSPNKSPLGWNMMAKHILLIYVTWVRMVRNISLGNTVHSRVGPHNAIECHILPQTSWVTQHGPKLWHICIEYFKALLAGWHRYAPSQLLHPPSLFGSPTTHQHVCPCLSPRQTCYRYFKYGRFLPAWHPYAIVWEMLIMPSCHGTIS